MKLERGKVYIYDGIILKGKTITGLIKIYCKEVHKETYEITVDLDHIVFQSKFHDDNDEYFVEKI